ncbi:MAG: PaaI family thioesterase [Pseudomonadota bacterium]
MTPVPPPGFQKAVGTDPAEDRIGPFFMNRTATDCRTALFPETHHTNLLGTVHGGVLMTFADFTFCAVGKTGSDDASIVTVSLTTEFVRAAPTGVWLFGEGAITRRTGSLVFVQGRLCQSEGEAVMTFSGIGKRIFGDS